MTLATIRDKNGLHARPASRVAGIARQFPGKVTIGFHEKHCSAKKVLSLLSLDLCCGDTVTISTAGNGGEQVEEALREALEAPGDLQK